MGTMPANTSNVLVHASFILEIFRHLPFFFFFFSSFHSTLPPSASRYVSTNYTSLSILSMTSVIHTLVHHSSFHCLVASFTYSPRLDLLFSVELSEWSASRLPSSAPWPRSCMGAKNLGHTFAFGYHLWHEDGEKSSTQHGFYTPNPILSKTWLDSALWIPGMVHCKCLRSAPIFPRLHCWSGPTPASSALS